MSDGVITAMNKKTKKGEKSPTVDFLKHRSIVVLQCMGTATQYLLEIQGSLDGENWVRVDDFEDCAPSIHTVVIPSLRYVRLEIKECVGGDLTVKLVSPQ